MTFKSKTENCKYIFELVVFIIVFRKCGQLYNKIIRHLNFAWLIIIIIIHRVKQKVNATFIFKKFVDQFFKLNNC